MEASLRPGVAFFWSLLCPGLGQLYNGQPLKAAGFWLGSMLLSLGMLFSFPLLLGTTSVVWIFFETLVLHLAVAVEAGYTARRRGWTQQALYRRPWAILLIWLALWALGEVGVKPLLQGSLPYWPSRSYYIPSGSMIPTLEINDYIMVDAQYYRKHPPALNEIAVFVAPRSMDGERAELVKRILGLPGDRIQIADGALLRNGKPADTPFIHELIDGEFKELTVPPGCVWVMGDNANNSSDSRVYGPVPIENLRGKALYVFWPWERRGNL